MGFETTVCEHRILILIVDICVCEFYDVGWSDGVDMAVAVFIMSNMWLLLSIDIPLLYFVRAAFYSMFPGRLKPPVLAILITSNALFYVAI